MTKLFVLLALLIPALALAQASNHERLSAITNLQRFAFGSCSKQTHTQKAWKVLAHEAPDFFLWGGDNVYADTDSEAQMRATYAVQNAVEDYRAFKAVTPVIGNWDDHDFGINNGGGSFSFKKMSQSIFLDFVEEPQDSPRRTQEGIYTSYEFLSAGRKVKFILLDNRYFKELEETAPILGAVQWTWLENELATSTADLTFISSGLSILSPKTLKSEEWADHPGEVKRLKALLTKYKVKAPIFLTGDKHFASIFEKDGIIEFLASGMTHNSPFFLRPFIRRKYPVAVFKHNFGLVDIRWEGAVPVVTMTIKSDEGEDLVVRRARYESGSWQVSKE